MKTFAWILFFLSLLTLGFVLSTFEKRDELENGVAKEALQVEVLSEKETSEPVRFLHFGDLMLDRGVKKTIERGADPFEFIKDLIHSRQFDLVIANLEGPFTSNTDCQIKPYSFRFEPEYVSFLQNAGITAVTLSNNHIFDCFRAGLNDTKEILSVADIDFFGGLEEGGGTVLFKDFQGTRIAFLGFDDTLKIQSSDEMKNAIKSAAIESDLVIVNIHWGEEYRRAATEAQRDLAHEFATSGASLIVGHHPHVIEPFEVVAGIPTFYSLGNFVFDQETLETQTGFAVETTFLIDKKTLEINLHPYQIIRNQPTLLEGEERKEICAQVLPESENGGKDVCAASLRL